MDDVLDDIILAIHNNLPQYNEDMLKRYTEREVNNSPDVVELIFKQALLQFDGQIQFIEKRILSPEERVAFELQTDSKSKQPARAGVIVVVSEWVLVRYMFRFDHKDYVVHLYLPYIKDDAITIRVTRYNVLRTITERVFSPTMDGVSIKLIRQPIRFHQEKQHKFISILDPNDVYYDWVITTDLYRKNQRSVAQRLPIKTTVLLYLLCKFGWYKTLNMLELNPNDFQIVDKVGNDILEYDYFLAKKKTKQTEMYLKVRREHLRSGVIDIQAIRGKKFVANYLYIAQQFDRFEPKQLMTDDTNAYRIMWGRITHGGSGNEPQVKSHADTHIDSLDTYLDPNAKARLHKMDIRVEDIYDLLRYVFIELDRMTANAKHSNLYPRRLDIMQSILINQIGTIIFRNFYNTKRDAKTLTDRDVNSLFRIRPDLIARIYDEKNISTDSDVYGDNWLLSSGSGKIRSSGLGTKRITPSAPEHRMHPSIMVVETAISFTGKSPGITGDINPFLQIDADGNIAKDRMEYAKDIDEILLYLQPK